MIRHYALVWDPWRATSRRTLLSGLLATVLMSAALQAQSSSGSREGALAGGLLGAYSGSLLSLTGSLIPCGQTLAGPTCSGWVTGIGAIIAATGGAAIGAGDGDRLVARVEAGAIGAVAGGVVGYALKGIVRQYGWLDVASGAALGMAIGSSAKGSAIGFGAGVVAGAVLLAAVPSFRVTDAVSVSLAGLAIGGVLAWVADGAEAQRDGDVPIMFSVSFIP